MHDTIISDTGISGTFYVTVGDTAFPEDGWFDMITDDLEQWVPRLTSFAMNHTDHCELDFLDGPCCIRLTRREDGVFVRCLWEHVDVIKQTRIDLNSFLSSVTKCIGHYQWVMQNNKFRKQLRLLKECIDTGENHV